MTQTTQPIILAVDTSSPQASYALFSGERQLARLVTTAKTPHSHTFFGNIETLLQQANLTINEITMLAAVTGPGSFTGLRVALAAVQGFAQTLSIPAWGLNTLDATALAAKVTGRVVVMLEAGRGECYVGLRDIRSDGSFTQPHGDAVAPLESIHPDFFEAGSHVTGSSVLCEWAVTQNEAIHFQPTPNPPLAPVIATFVACAIQRGVTAERHPLQACYIRPPDAKLKINA